MDVNILKEQLLAVAVVLVTAANTLVTDVAYVDSSDMSENYVYSSSADDNIYSVRQLGEGYRKPREISGRKIINVPIIDQFPELPVGCEITSAAAVLQYLGFDIDKLTLTKNYLVWDDDFTYDAEKNISYGPNPYMVFAGDPYNWGYGCFAPVITETMNKYFSAQNADLEAVQLGDLSSSDIEKLIDEGVPLIVWASRGMKEYNYKDPSEWIINGTDRKFTWYGNSHTLVLCGYDENYFYFMDCDGKKLITPYAKNRFMTRFREKGSQCVAVKDNRHKDQ